MDCDSKIIILPRGQKTLTSGPGSFLTFPRDMDGISNFFAQQNYYFTPGAEKKMWNSGGVFSFSQIHAQRKYKYNPRKKFKKPWRWG